MNRSPYPAEGIALARRTLTDGTYLTGITPGDRAELVRLAFDILKKDRAARLGLDRSEPQGPARVITIPRAVFEAGLSRPRQRPRRRRIVVRPITPDPGDAA